MKHRFIPTVLLVLSLTTMLLLSACASATEPANSSAQEVVKETSQAVVGMSGDISESDLAEVQLASDLGLLTGTFSGDFSDFVSRENMETLAKNAVELFYKTTVEPDLSALESSKNKETISRLDTAIIITETVRAALGEYPVSNGDPYRPEELEDYIGADDEALYEQKSNPTIQIRLWGDADTPLFVESACYVTRQLDQVSYKPVLPLDNHYLFHASRKVTQLEAIQAALRLYRSFDPVANYVSLKDVTTHTISKDLYSDESVLPDASNQHLPAWHGILHFPKCWANAQSFGSNNDSLYHESDFQIMRDAGLNMVAIYINPTRLGWPYGDEDVTKVNTTELELLDQAIGWAFENGIHVQLSFNGVPGLGRYSFEDMFQYDRLFDDDATARLLADYWRMIAHRYADIPNRYLGFTLMNEVNPPSEADYIRAFGPSIDAIWEESPDRIIIADIHSDNLTGESMAKKGVCLSRHLYPLPLLDYDLSGDDGGGLMALYPDYADELTWPLLYLPSMLHGNQNAVTLNGNFTAGEMTIGVNQISEGNEILRVMIDGSEAMAEPFEAGEERNSWNMLPVDREYTVSIPEGAKEIVLSNKANNGVIVYNRLKITQSGANDIILYPHDAFNINWEPESITIQIGANGSLDGNRFVTWDDLKAYGDTISYNNIKAVAEQYGVGFIVGEFGPFGEDGLPHDVMEGYLSLMMQGMQEDNVGWANGSFVGKGQLVFNCPEADPENTYEPFDHSPYSVNVFMRDLYRKYSSLN